MSAEIEAKKKELIGFFLEKGLLLSPEILEHIESLDSIKDVEHAVETIKANQETTTENKELFVNKEVFLNSLNSIEKNQKPHLSHPHPNSEEPNKIKENSKEDHKEDPEADPKEDPKKNLEADPNKDPEAEPNTDLNKEPNKNASVNVVFSYSESPKKREIQDFTKLFNIRYERLKNILMNRKELQDAISISRAKTKPQKDPATIIAMVYTKQETKNGNIIFEVEDPSGRIKVLASKNNSEILKFASSMVQEDVVGISGVLGQDIIFANEITLPDVPLNKELKKCPEEAFAVFISDIHVGSDCFLPEEFDRFIKWIRQEAGNDQQKEIAKKVKYIFVVGDVVDGVGIYPGQQSELTIQDIKSQYDEVARLLKQIPQDISIIISPGNHDALRIAEPQPLLDKKYAEQLWGMPNVIMVTNPSMVNINAVEGFSGFDVLLYHGYSFDWYVANVDSIRNSGGYDRADLIMRFMLQRRHLAPAYTSTLYVPDIRDDYLVINKIPDIFVTGHIHKCAVSHYKNITTISGSCWQSTTPFQEKVGHNPEPGRVPLVNLKTREVKIMKFTTD
ncbi:DNA-directed DNA polymerase II small subunit [Nanoarchaeota archaeon]